jgi:predicted ribosome quality control (RQC) complex YloA/Tae2 family protein
LLQQIISKQASNSGAELAREKLRQDLEKEIQKNRDAIMENRQHIAILEDRQTVPTKKIKPLTEKN